MFPDTGKSLSGLKHNSKNDSSGITDSCPGCGRPHTAHPVAKISKVKDPALIVLISAFGLLSLPSSSVKIASLAIVLLHFFTHSQPLNEMFIVSSRLNLVAVATLLLTSFLHRWNNQVLSNLESFHCNFFHFWSRDVHPVQNLLLCTKFHRNRMIFHWDMAIYRFSNYFQIFKFNIPAAVLSEIVIWIMANTSSSYEENRTVPFFRSQSTWHVLAALASIHTYTLLCPARREGGSKLCLCPSVRPSVCPSGRPSRT